MVKVFKKNFWLTFFFYSRHFLAENGLLTRIGYFNSCIIEKGNLHAKDHLTKGLCAALLTFETVQLWLIHVYYHVG